MQHTTHSFKQHKHIVQHLAIIAMYNDMAYNTKETYSKRNRFLYHINMFEHDQSPNDFSMIRKGIAMIINDPTIPDMQPIAYIQRMNDKQKR